MCPAEALIEDVRASIAELRSLAHGLCPPVLSDRGLAEALREMIVRASGRCRLESVVLPRFIPEVEPAAYGAASRRSRTSPSTPVRGPAWSCV